MNNSSGNFSGDTPGSAASSGSTAQTGHKQNADPSPAACVDESKTEQTPPAASGSQEATPKSTLPAYMQAPASSPEPAPICPPSPSDSSPSPDPSCSEPEAQNCQQTEAPQPVFAQNLEARSGAAAGLGSVAAGTSVSIAVAPDGTATCPSGYAPAQEPARPAGQDKAQPQPQDQPKRDAQSAECAAPSGFAQPQAGTGQGQSGTRPATPKPQSPSFFKTHPVLTAPQTMPPSICSRLFNALALFPLLPLTLMLLAQTIFSLDARDLWYSDEIRHANAFQSLLEHGKWLILEMNGQPYPDKPPVYFWFLRGLYELVRTDGPMLYFAAAAVSALMYLWASLSLGRLVARVDGRTNLAAGIILMSCGYLVGTVHYARMDLLFSAVILCSHVALYHAVVSRRRFSVSMLLGFALAGVATLIKGPLGLALPLAAMVVFVFWRGTPRRLLRLDFLVGLVTACAVIGLWVGAIYWQTGSMDYLVESILKRQVLERAVDTFHHKEAWHYYLVRLPLVLLPWTLILFFLPWRSFLSKSMREGIAASRRPEGEGIAFLWCMAITGVAVLSVLSGKIHIYLLPVLPAFAILGGRAMLQISGTRAALLRHSVAVFMLVAGLALIVASLMLFDVLPMPSFKGVPQWQLPVNTAFFIVAVMVLLTAAALWFILRSSRPEGVLLMVALATTALAYPLCNMAAPSFNAVLSPKAQALMMRAYIDRGYTAASYDVYGGTYSYYADAVIRELPSLAEAKALAEQGNLVLAVRRSTLDKWQDKPACLEEVHKQWIETREHVLLACPRIADLAPALPRYAPAPDLIDEVEQLLGTKPKKAPFVKPAATPVPAAVPSPTAPATVPGEVPGSTGETHTPPAKAPVDASGVAPAETPADAPAAPAVPAPATPQESPVPNPASPETSATAPAATPAPQAAPADTAAPQQPDSVPPAKPEDAPVPQQNAPAATPGTSPAEPVAPPARTETTL